VMGEEVMSLCENCGGEVPVGETHSCPDCGLDPLCPSCVCENCPSEKGDDRSAAEEAAEAMVAKARAEREERRVLGSTAKKGFRGRNYMQTTCIWCGNHRQVTRCGSVCQKVSPSVRSALMRFAREYGRTWRSVLKKSWESACADVADPAWRALLQEARNVIGPRRLHKVEFTNL
jgi:hypothetical protein